MYNLLNIVKEQGIVEMIINYKDQFEYADWKNRMDTAIEKLNKIKKMHSERQLILSRCSQIDKDGNFYYRDLLKQHLHEKIKVVREEILKLEIERYEKNYEEEVVEIIQEDNVHIGATGTTGTVNIGATGTTGIHIGTTGHNNMLGATVSL